MHSEIRDMLQSSLGTGYRLSRELGGGGIAKVFVADDDAGRRVVLKVLPPDLAAGVNVERFRREIELAARFHHPRIVPIVAAGQTGDVLYFTMKYIEGESLRALLAREKRLAPDHALELARDIADALLYAHGQNIVHRDIKPENVLIERGTGHALVTDFGIARAIQRSADIQSVTSTGHAVGTPTYMSPEQAAAERDIDGRSDIYSLGCVLFEMIAGAPPFTGPSWRAVTARHINEPAPLLRTVRDDVPEPIERVVNRMLAKSPDDRFPNAAALLDALRKPESVKPPSARRWRPSRGMVIAAAAFLAAAALISFLVARG